MLLKSKHRNIVSKQGGANSNYFIYKFTSMF